MSRVYTEKVVNDVVQGTAAYIWEFFGALAETRLEIAATPGFGGSLLDFFLNVLGTSDPYIEQEIAITKSWSQWDVWHTVDEPSSLLAPRTHKIPLSFKAEWPPPQQWAAGIDWHPLSQNSARHRYFGRFRSRRSRRTAEAV